MRMKMMSIDHAVAIAKSMGRDARGGRASATMINLSAYLNQPQEFRAKGTGVVQRATGVQAERMLEKRLAALGMHITDRP